MNPSTALTRSLLTAGVVLGYIAAAAEHRWAAGVKAPAATLNSIQVRAVPMAEKADGMAIYRALRDKEYLVYFYLANLHGKR